MLMTPTEKKIVISWTLTEKNLKMMVHYRYRSFDAQNAGSSFMVVCDKNWSWNMLIESVCQSCGWFTRLYLAKTIGSSLQ